MRVRDRASGEPHARTPGGERLPGRGACGPPAGARCGAWLAARAPLPCHGAMADEPTAVQLFGRGATPRDTRERILHTALDLFYAHGFHAVGLDRILAEVGVTKTTFYNHFESRDALVLECVKLRDTWEIEEFQRQVQARGGYDPRALLLAIFDVMDAWFNDERYRGCLFIAASAEFPSRSDPVHRAAAGHFTAIEADVRRMAEAAGSPDPPALARTWVLLIEGATTYRLVTGDGSIARTAAETARQVLDRHLPVA